MMMDNLPESDLELLRRDTCPACDSTLGFDDGPRGGAGRNIFCRFCGEGYNVAMPRMIMMAQKIGKRT